MLPFSPAFCLLGLLSLGEVSSGGGGGGGGGATFSLLGEMVSSNQRPKMGSLSSSVNMQRARFISKFMHGSVCRQTAAVSTNRIQDYLKSIFWKDNKMLYIETLQGWANAEICWPETQVALVLSCLLSAEITDTVTRRAGCHGGAVKQSMLGVQQHSAAELNWPVSKLWGSLTLVSLLLYVAFSNCISVFHTLLNHESNSANERTG